MREFEGLRVPCEPMRDWKKWMCNTYIGAGCSTTTYCPPYADCHDCIYSVHNAEARKRFYEQTFGIDATQPALVSGSFIQMKSGTLYFIYNNHASEVTTSLHVIHTWAEFKLGASNMLSVIDPNSIQKIWLPTDMDSKDDFTECVVAIDKGYVKPSWVRPEQVKEVTMKDVEEKFGCKVKIKREE